MSHEYINRIRIGRELCEWVFLGIRTGARKGAEEYNRLKATDMPEAILQLKRAVDMPHRVRARINQFITDHNPGAGVFLADCVDKYSNGNVTLAELDAELTVLEIYCLDLYTRNQAGTLTPDEAATDIIEKVENEAQKWVFPFPENYVDIWGV